jgi:hypothetical protein
MLESVSETPPKHGEPDFSHPRSPQSPNQDRSGTDMSFSRHLGAGMVAAKIALWY